MREKKLRSRIQPDFNKLFKNKIRGIIDERVALKNLDSTKQKMQEDYAMPPNSKVYNFIPLEIRRMIKILNHQFPDDHAKEKKALDLKLKNRGMGLGIALLAVTIYSLGMRFGSKWSRLTCGSIFHYTFVQYVAFPSIAYIVLDHMEDDISLLFKYHANYE